MSVTLKHFYKFDPFILDIEERVLLRDGRPIAVTPKVFDTLLLLVENQGCVVSKQKILDTLWPDVFVEESNVTFNITMLRKALGDTKREPLYIETVSRRGYRFKTDVREVVAQAVRAHEIEVKPEFGDDRNRQVVVETGNRLQLAADTPKNGTRHRELEQANEPAVLTQVPTLNSGWKLSKSHTLVFALVPVLLIVGLAIWYLSRGNSGREHKTLARMPLTAAALKFEQITNSGNVVSAAISPDGKQVA